MRPETKKPLLNTYGSIETKNENNFISKRFQELGKHSFIRTSFFLVILPFTLYLLYVYVFSLPFPYEMKLFGQLSQVEKIGLYHQFKTLFGKDYLNTGIEKLKLDTFLENCAIIHKHNNNPKSTYSLHVNQFADMSLVEFNQKYASGFMEETYVDTSMSRRRMSKKRRKKYDETVRRKARRWLSDGEDTEVAEVGIKKSLDWHELGLVTPAKSQNSCGACYIFSTQAAIESRCAILDWPLVDLSVQETLDCIEDQSCVKGFQSHVYKWGIIHKGYLPNEKYRPYDGMIRSCKENPEKHTDRLQSWGKISSHSEQETMEKLQQGPLSTAICTTKMDWRFVAHGVVRGGHCEALTHGVTLIGYGHDTKSDLDYWIIKNSWGPLWGQNGFAHLCRGAKCGAGSTGYGGILKQIFYPECSDYGNGTALDLGGMQLKKSFQKSLLSVVHSVGNFFGGLF